MNGLCSFQSLGSTGQVQTNPAYVDPRDSTNTSERSFNHRVRLNNYQNIHSIQTTSHFYDTVQQTNTPVYETVM